MTAQLIDGRFYRPEKTEEVARIGKAFATIGVAQCEDGLWRYTIGYQHSYGGCGGPVFASTPGFTSESQAKDAAMTELIEKLAGAEGNGDPEHAQNEVRQLRAALNTAFQQPSLF